MPLQSEPRQSARYQRRTPCTVISGVDPTIGITLETRYRAIRFPSVAIARVSGTIEDARFRKIGERSREKVGNIRRSVLDERLDGTSMARLPSKTSVFAFALITSLPVCTLQANTNISGAPSVRSQNTRAGTKRTFLVGCLLSRRVPISERTSERTIGARASVSHARARARTSGPGRRTSRTPIQMRSSVRPVRARECVRSLRVSVRRCVRCGVVRCGRV